MIEQMPDPARVEDDFEKVLDQAEENFFEGIAKIAAEDRQRSNGDGTYRHKRHYRHETDTDKWLSPDRSVLRETVRPAPEFPLELFGPWEKWLRSTAEG